MLPLVKIAGSPSSSSRKLGEGLPPLIFIYDLSFAGTAPDSNRAVLPAALFLPEGFKTLPVAGKVLPAEGFRPPARSEAGVFLKFFNLLTL